MQDPIPVGAIDLAQVKERADERDEALAQIAAQREQDEAMALVADWDRKMRSAFKGIMPSPERRAMLRRSVSDES